MAVQHVPVMLSEVLEGLQVVSGGKYIDATVGGGGHAAAILVRSSPDGTVLGLDADPSAIGLAGRRLAGFGQRVRLVHSSFVELKQQAESNGFRPADGVLLDLGLSSAQLDDQERGFSFSSPGPLDMRFDPTRGVPAAELVNSLSQEELADTLRRFGEEPAARRIARAIVAHRPVTTAEHLGRVVQAAVGRGRRIHPATRTFQALRIAVNDELGALEQALPQAIELLRAGGRLVVISFHSLEDRIVKLLFRREASQCVCPPQVPTCLCGHRATVHIVTRRPQRPSPAEVELNPRARSARLRVVERLSEI